MRITRKLKSFVLFSFCWLAIFFIGKGFQYWAIIRHGEFHEAELQSGKFLDAHLTPLKSIQKPKMKPKVTCSFPQLNPWDPKIMSTIQRYPALNCHESIPSIVDIVGNELRINSTKIRTKISSHLSGAWCQYRNISMMPRVSIDVVYGPWSKPFNSAILIEDEEEFFLIECYHGKNNLISVSYLALVRKKKDIEVRRSKDFKDHLEKNKPKEMLNVLLVGVDGMSKQNFARTMPKTKMFIKHNLQAIEFNKFNKVGLNTFPNIIPLLTGRHEEKLPSYWNENKTFDMIDHLFIWNRYQNAGYRTSLMFDNTFINAFHYLKEGWKHAPFDYYPRPVVIASEFDPDYRSQEKNCMGDIPEVSLLLDYWLQLDKVFKSPSTPYFAYSFFTRLTHDDQNLASAGDELYLEFFKEVEMRNVLSNTVLIFFSDHGLRFGGMRDTYNGIMESRMPYLFFMFPPWFRKKYPQLMENFQDNKDRLVTPFDIHETLKHLLTFTGQSRPYSPTSRGISLFSTIPHDRTCKDASIPLKFCSCVAMSHNDTTPPEIRKDLEMNFLEKVISVTEDHRDKCVLLEHKKTVWVLLLTPEIPFRDENEALYHVTIETTPGNALYEATLLYHKQYRDVMIVGDIVRINMYRGQAECVTNIFLRSFCYCKNI